MVYGWFLLLHRPLQPHWACEELGTMPFPPSDIYPLLRHPIGICGAAPESPEVSRASSTILDALALVI